MYYMGNSDLEGNSALYLSLNGVRNNIMPLLHLVIGQVLLPFRLLTILYMTNITFTVIVIFIQLRMFYTLNSLILD